MTPHVALIIVLVLSPVLALRQKRVSDQRLAELETLVALSGLKGKIANIPYGFGAIDPAKLGRRRRSSGVLLERLLAGVTGSGRPGPWPWLSAQTQP